MNKEKIYKFDRFGYTEMILETRQEKINKISSIISVGLVIGLFTIGFLGKEMFIIIIANMGIGKVTNWLIG